MIPGFRLPVKRRKNGEKDEKMKIFLKSSSSPSYFKAVCPNFDNFLQYQNFPASIAVTENSRSLHS